MCSDGQRGYHLGFNVTRGNMNCWRCGPIKLLDGIQGILRCSREKALEALRTYSDGKRTRAAPARIRRREVIPPPGLGPLLGVHRKYLKGRGITLGAAEDWGLQGTRHLSGLWSWRVCGPIKNEAGDIVCWLGRSIVTDAKPKYRLTDNDKCAEDPKTFLYGIEKVSGDSVIIVEGPADAWNVGPGAVALLGIDWKQEQANKLRRFQRRYVMFDPEPKAQARAQELAEWLSLFPGVTEVVDGLPSDPGSLGRGIVRKLRKSLLGVRG